MIVHITTRSAWEQAETAGSYAPPSLAREGFIHFSDPGQVLTVAEAAYSQTPDLVLLCVTADRLSAPLKYESADGDRFPHLYGALNLDAVVEVVPFARGEHGFTLPDALR
ncbi:MAG: DUF952 domain-containing protein [Solirubrobacteraceae bacterium]